MTQTESHPTTTHSRARILEIVEHLGHLLPSQGPITTFVHHNTLHGLQHLPFEDAVAAGEDFFGANGYLSVETSRARYREGRINDADLDEAVAGRPELADAEIIGTVGGRTLTDADIRRLHLIHGTSAIDPAALRFAVLERDATQRLLDDVIPEARSQLFVKSARELTNGIERIGQKLTVGGWLGELLGIDIDGAVRSTVISEINGEATPRRGTPTLMKALGIPASRANAYLHLVDLRLDGVSGTDIERARRLWLVAEARLVDRVARRHFHLPGKVDAIERGLRADVEKYAITALWNACLRAFGLSDPLSSTDPQTLGPRDLDGSVDALADLFISIQDAGGPPVSLSANHREELLNAVHDELDEMQKAVGADPATAGSSVYREAASGAWFVLSEVDGDALGRTGFDALRDLALLRPESEIPAVSSKVAAFDPREGLAAEAQEGLECDLREFGRRLTHAQLVARLTGEDPGVTVNNYLIRLCAAFLDTGLAAWRMPDRTLGLYGAWRASVKYDPTLALAGVRDWPGAVAALPDDPAEAVAQLLDQLGVTPENQHAYLSTVVACLPGWAGMMTWWGTHPDYLPQEARPTDLVQFLAVRLAVETALVAQRLNDALNIDTPNAAVVSSRLRARPLEHYVRTQLHKGNMPSMLAQIARDLERKGRDGEWTIAADQIWAWHRQPEADVQVLAADRVWRLFRISQLAGWSAGEVAALSPAARDRILSTLDSFPEKMHRPIWFSAFERHYREEILGALAANYGKGRWQVRDRRPKAQIVFCIDEREESMHRAVDELDPEYETFGAGGFFNMAMDYSGLDDHHITPLCPAGMIPSNRVKEIPRLHAKSVGSKRLNRRRWKEVAENAYWELKRNAVSGFFLTQLVGLAQAMPLAGKVLTPWGWTEFTEGVERRLIPRPATELTVDGEGYPGLGYALSEQVDRVEIQLRNIGLTHHYARLIVFIGHGSLSVNNPHESAHDCGACGGKHGASNARAFAALANRRQVREELAKRGLNIPEDTYFVGGIHNTASDRNTFFDTEDIPESHRVEWEELRRNLDEARARSARERCRRFDSAPKGPSLRRAVRHVEGRSRDLSQVRPEWGHCTNAVAVVGRRALTQGLFLDRRTFVISYDPNVDPDGSIVQRILLAMGPVGAGINLEYYFSTVDNKVFGCGTKVPHNVTGLLGVMEGAASDLRTGLPKQMVELHEPMRLLLIVESSQQVLGGIYQSQPAIAELLDNEWVHLVSVDPESGDFSLFQPGKGFVAWEGWPADLPRVRSSWDWYGGRLGFLPPARIEAEVMQ